MIGSGPAGLSLAAALSERDVDVLCVSPRFDPWVPVYGSFVDDLAGLDIPFDRTWDRALVSLPGRSDRFLSRPYGRIDRPSLFSRWVSRLESLDQLHPSSVTSALFSPDSVEVRLSDDSAVHARHVFDCSGHSPKLVERDPTGYGFQCALGRVVTKSPHDLDEKTMGLMLWDNARVFDGEGVQVPLFDYVMHDAKGKQFVERTVLSAREKIPLSKLDPALDPQVVSSSEDERHIERCIIPMGHQVPGREQRVVGFGGAASMVHPATGYMVARVFRTAGPLADAYVETDGMTAKERSRHLWRVVWPDEWVRTHELYQFGLEVLLRLTPQQTWDFFDAFFDLPDEQWQPYQSGTATVREVVLAMQGVFRRVPLALKTKLIAASASPRGKHLGRLFY